MKTVLVIDDDSEFRGALAALLRSQGWNVMEAGEGEAGVALARQHRPRAILCDLLMPGTNGFRVCSLIRNDHSLRYTLLIAMSGRDFDDTRQSAFEAGADEFLPKPVDTRRLLDLLGRMSAPPPGTGKEFDTTRLIRSGAAFLRFWGVRGSVPVPGRGTVRYGGNTSCIEVRVDGEILILDSGTGIRPLGDELVREFGDQPINVALLISHSHWDHVQGFPFFLPAYDARNVIRIYGFEGTRDGLAGIFSGQMESPYFPIGLGQLPGHLIFEELKEMRFQVGSVQIEASFANHPGICVGYRLRLPRQTIVYVPDHEPFSRKLCGGSGTLSTSDDLVEFARAEDEKFIEFIRGADILILDAQYSEEEYQAHVGWGHSCVQDAVDLALRGGVKRLLLFHHDPGHDDATVDDLLKVARQFATDRGSSMEIDSAREGLTLPLG